MKIGFIGILIILFIALKLTNIITWSWFWVLSPIWINIILVIAIIGIYEAIKTIREESNAKKRIKAR